MNFNLRLLFIRSLLLLGAGLPAGKTGAQVPLSGKNISLEEVQVKPRAPKVWVQKGKPPLLPRLSHSIGFYDFNGKPLSLSIYLNKVEVISSNSIQVAAIETRLEPFENDSFDVFFFAMQIQGPDTLITRKLIPGKDIRRKHYTLQFNPGELTLLPQPAYLGFQFVPNKISTSRTYVLHTATRNNSFYGYHEPSRTLIKRQGAFGLTFNFKMRYYEL